MSHDLSSESQSARCQQKDVDEDVALYLACSLSLCALSLCPLSALSLSVFSPSLLCLSISLFVSILSLSLSYSLSLSLLNVGWLTNVERELGLICEL